MSLQYCTLGPWDQVSTSHGSEGTYSVKEAGVHSPNAEEKIDEFLFIQRDISRCIKKPQVSVVKKKENQTSVNQVIHLMKTT